MPPALVVERFDIRTDADDEALRAMEDMCSVLDPGLEGQAHRYDRRMWLREK